MSRKLKIYYNKKFKDVYGEVPSSEKGMWDVHLMFNVFLLGYANRNSISVLEELQNRGYDISTLKFSIKKKRKRGRFKYNKFPSIAITKEDLINDLKYCGYHIKHQDERSLTFVYSGKEYKEFSIVKNETSGFWQLSLDGETKISHYILKHVCLLIEILDNKQVFDESKLKDEE